MNKNEEFKTNRVILVVFLVIILILYFNYSLYNCEGIPLSDNYVTDSVTDIEMNRLREYAEILVLEKFGDNYYFTTSGVVYKTVAPYSTKARDYYWFEFSDSEKSKNITIKYDVEQCYFQTNPVDEFYLIPIVSGARAEYYKNEATKKITNIYGSKYEFNDWGVQCKKYPPHTVDVIDYYWFEFIDSETEEKVYVK